MLEVRQLSCIRDERMLFEDLSFTLSPGDLVQIEGPNGAGKTTLLRIIAGLGLAESGDVLWQGEPVSRVREAFYGNLLFLGHSTGVKREMTAFENLAFYQRMHGDTDESVLWDVLARVGLAGREDVPAAQLSAGQNRRVALARLWISKSKLWVLDEPLTAIDKQGVKVLETLFEEHVNSGGMVLFTTHQDMFSGNPTLRRIRLGA
ncbi:cytochrome c biogenesis heme-transporting ATPase CcmA [Grimontia hollisae]|uniref:ABC transporter involved in cytochrome c biogenesis ATPase component CcmA n=1 Tax=Grimontia hollisae CIP 101886 TaxID=675812 RepID=D0IC73_GRIHO|nr:cytochrome c biogenesis heme-transporting ATPase CcmA [Grimontia hollisae]AMG29866.1 cytochrome c biogenesis heme-transporting ATPase CcmA [Grimontia hollisae]EEY71491.1 ABC transporter involved in cytochrome c biogenesis ATPase component CcmA [Grimontia hollisae CIP 101886]STO43168.1 Cytochrome c biogenesis ATP-binding export protein CcmA [Grimontia hollisae]